MGCSQEKRASQKTLDTVFHILRTVDIELWTGEKYRVEDVEENVASIKRYLDEMVTQFKSEVGYVEPPPKPPCDCGCGGKHGHNWTLEGLANQLSQPMPTLIKPFPEPTPKSEWQVTPIIPKPEGPK